MVEASKRSEVRGALAFVIRHSSFVICVFRVACCMSRFAHGRDGEPHAGPGVSAKRAKRAKRAKIGRLGQIFGSETTCTSPAAWQPVENPHLVASGVSPIHAVEETANEREWTRINAGSWEL